MKYPDYFIITIYKMFCIFCKEYYGFIDEAHCSNKKCFIVQSFIKNNGIEKMADIIIKNTTNLKT